MDYLLPLDNITFTEWNDRESSITVELADEEVLRWAMGLVLVERGLADAVRAVYGREARKLIVKVIDGANNHRGQVNLDGQITTIGIDRAGFEYMLEWCLHTIRDGYPEVDHVDIEHDVPGHPDKVCTFTVKVSHFAPTLPDRGPKRSGRTH